MVPNRTLAIAATLSAVAMLTGCYKQGQGANVAENTTVVDMNATDAPTTNQPDYDRVAAEITRPTHHYQDQEGTHYLYVTAVSEEDRKIGKAVGDVIQYEYAGSIDGRLTLLQVAENGYMLAQLECPRDCKIIKMTLPNGVVSRLPFDSSSIAGAAMEDALNGFLQPVPRQAVSRFSSRAPVPDVSTPPVDSENTDTQFAGGNAT